MRKIARKIDRQAALSEIIRTKRIGKQDELRRELGRLGIESTQSSISRDLIELNITKLRGVYRIPVSSSEGATAGVVLDVDTAGDHLVVVKTPPGQASMLALVVDREKIPGVVGTVAGDDTFFAAVRSPADQRSFMKHIHKLTG